MRFYSDKSLEFEEERLRARRSRLETTPEEIDFDLDYFDIIDDSGDDIYDAEEG
jgi:hypothetical protein|uniref:Uncharacterized protein n=1 Tax=Siphoviridae sp. ctrCN24 TaxID=2827953 RepID=A0A8S5SLS6_9CAUD|nr:MAG TPA: hypothetical protein [Siphoviridae sp. ctrCN24]